MFESILIVMLVTLEGEYVEIEYETYSSRVECLHHKSHFDTTLMELDTSKITEVDTMCDNRNLTEIKL